MMSSLRDRTTPLAPPGMSTGMTGISSRNILNRFCGLAAISGSMPDSGFWPYPASSVAAADWASADCVSVMEPPGLCRADLQHATDGLHERGLVRLGDDPAREEESDDDVGQLLTIERALGDSGHGVERVAEPLHQLAAQRGQVVEEVAQHELGLRLEEAPRGMRADEVERVGDEDTDPFRRNRHGGEHLVQPGAKSPLVVVGGRRQDVVLAREVAIQGAA